jgi:prepilin-type N-terminal cleavage/methylation domain-containing protein/prepilin-type processing-associated H-X9-DG protein
MKKPGFSLVELLVVIAIIGVLLGLLFPAIQRARESAARSKCLNNMHQLITGMHGYEGARKVFPPAYVTADTRANGTDHFVAYGDAQHNGPTGFAWGVFILPYLEQGPLFRAFNITQSCWAPENAEAAKTKVSVFLCPTASGGSEGFDIQREGSDVRHGTPFAPSIHFAHSHYVTNAGVNQPWGRESNYCYDYDVAEPIPAAGNKLARIDGPFYRNSRIGVRHVLDGLSKTVFLGEHTSFLCNKTWVGVVPGAVTPPRLDLRPWLSENNDAGCLVGAHSGPDLHDHPQVIIHAPNDPFGHTDEMYSEHGEGANVAFGDGSSRFISMFTDPDVWVALSTRDGNEVIHAGY